MARRWKSLISDSFLQLAVILSILRTDLRVYLRQYSQYPEVQQALLGQSVGLHIVDNYHNNDLLPLPSSKYVDVSDAAITELHRFVESSYFFRQSPVSTWLVTDTLSQASVSTASPSATSTVDSVELSQQDVALIELLWKEDVEALVGRAQYSVNSKEQKNSAEENNVDEGIGNSSFPLSPDFSSNAEEHAWPLHSSTDTESNDHRSFNTQSSLELALQDLNSFDETVALESQGATATNSSMLYPDEFQTQVSQGFEGNLFANSTGVLWGNAESSQFPEQNSLMDLEANTGDLSDLNFTLAGFDLLPESMELDFDLDTNGTFECLDNEDVDSAVGSSPSHSWYEGTSSAGSERHSVSSNEQYDMEDGAVGYTKTEPCEDKYYEPQRYSKYNTSAVSHNHTYGAPPGGVPHVRKMDMKTTKEPSRGLAHDQALCKKFKIPFSVEIIINSPMDHFNALLQAYKLSDKQITLIKDIRRRGKNKVAAQNCRQKRVGEHSELELEVEKLKTKRDTLREKHAVLLNKSTQVRKHIDIMSAEIFSTLRDEYGIPYNTSNVRLEVGRDGEIHVVSTEQTQRSRNGRKKDTSKRRR